MNILESIKTKFDEQKKKFNTGTKCPHCGKEIEFVFTHTQNTTVDTTLVEIVKKENK